MYNNNFETVISEIELLRSPINHQNKNNTEVAKLSVMLHTSN